MSENGTPHLDVLVIGAGLSGIGAGAHFSMELPFLRYLVLEARPASGGTWDLFRYPGIRSDSDMYTLGYAFKPWRDEQAIADGHKILAYLRETAREYDVESKIRYNHRVRSASWSSRDARWTVVAERTDRGDSVTFTCDFILSASGYYDYEQPHAPRFAGEAEFKGRLVHPQFWPDDLDYRGKRVVVIGSGATGITLVPAMAQAGAAHVTMLQRSPTYIVSLPGKDAFAQGVGRLLPAKVTYGVTRWKHVLRSGAFFALCRRAPEFAKKLIRRRLEQELGEGYDWTNFTPKYDPWDQRLCVVPDSDLFKEIRKGSVSVVTGEIERLTETGLQLKSGERLEADIVITATGLKLLMAGGVAYDVDGAAVDFSKTMTYKGLMISGVPNFALVIGYTNASWTLKADLVSTYVCRLLAYMRRSGYETVVPLRDPSVGEEPFLSLASGYVLRASGLPKQGDRRPWKLYQNYALDLLSFRRASFDDGTLIFGKSRETKAAPSGLAVSRVP